MGTAAPSKLAHCSIPSRPFDKHGQRRFCLGAVVLLPRTRNKTKYSSTLMQLILLRDWQRVLIRVTLFPQEVSKPCLIKLYGIYWKLLPLHLACALQPPHKVVSMLLCEGASSTRVEQRKKLRLLPDWKFLSHIRMAPGDRKELLTTPGEHYDHGHEVGSMETPSEWVAQNDFYHQPKGSLVSFEQSIGDMASYATRTMDGGDDMEASLGNFLDQKGVVLQLTEAGGITPIPILQSKDTTSLTEDSSPEFHQEPLLQAAAETKMLLPIHIAILYQSSPSVLQALLQNFPMGALSAILGMLPIHLVAAGWTVEPLEAASSASPFKLDEAPMVHIPETLQVLIQALPESVVTKSANHGMTPKEYIQENLETPKKEEYLELVIKALEDYRQKGPSPEEPEPSVVESRSSSVEVVPSEIHCLSSGSSMGTVEPPAQSPWYTLLLECNWSAAMDLLQDRTSIAREWHYGIDQNVDEPVLWKRLGLHLCCTVAAPVGLVDLLIRVYPHALASPDPHNGSLPLHLACQYGCSLQVIRALLLAKSDTTKAVDSKGRLPLHYAILAADSYPIINILVQHDPTSVLCPDQDGKTPLQYAQHAYQVGSPVIGLLELVWM